MANCVAETGKRAVSLTESARVISTSPTPHHTRTIGGRDRMAARQSISVRTRFEIFKRDDFRCRYCGRQSPAVILEVDHIVPRADGGSDDEINLITSCWDCNRGKAAVPLNAVMTGEDPHDRAIEIAERERQLREYNEVLQAERERREAETWELVAFWKSEQGYSGDALSTINRQDYSWLLSTLKWCPREVIRGYMEIALSRGITKNLKWVGACVRNWRVENGLDPEATL